MEKRVRKADPARRNASGRRRPVKRKKKSGAVRIIATVLFVALILGMLAVYLLWDRFSYGTERADLTGWFGEGGPEDFPLIVDNELTEYRARRIDGSFYISMEDLDALMTHRFYYGAADGILVYTTPEEIITNPVGTDRLQGTLGGESTRPYVISRLDGETLYLSLDYIGEYYNLSYTPYEAPNRIVAFTKKMSLPCAEIKKDTMLRHRGGVKSEILKELKKGERVIILEEMDEWIKVRSEDGFAGYVEVKLLTERTDSSFGSEDIAPPVYTSIKKPYTINLGWHYVAGPAGNDTLYEVTAQTRALNTISPTWISLNDNAGGIESFGSADYVEEAHRMGLEVWVLVRNFTYDHVDVHAVLRSAESRKALKENLIAEVKRLGADGINIDFEEVPQEAGKDYVQFLRELSIDCRREQLVFSIDNYVPYGFNDYYNRTEQGIIADYLIIMGYDEHYGSSQETGSVASIEYVRHGIEETVRQAPAEKVINAVPFYCRLWEVDASGHVTSQALGMESARQAAAENGMELVWDQETEQYYGRSERANGAYAEIWLEDAESIEAKISVMRANGIAGIACWRLGFETPDVWEVIESYVNGG